jgi:SulP family sulfate permease
MSASDPKTRLRAVAGYFPILDSGKTYDVGTLSNDLVAAVIVTIMLIPQSLAYALLAGLPAEMGLYASILPLVAYAVFGTSRALSVGPVAVVSLMTAVAVGNLALQGTAEYIAAAITLTFLSGLILLAMGLSPWFSGEFSQPSGHCRVYCGLWHFDRRQPVETHSWCRGAWPHAC